MRDQGEQQRGLRRNLQCSWRIAKGAWCPGSQRIKYIQEGVVTCQLLLMSVLWYLVIVLMWGLNGEWWGGSAPLATEPGLLLSSLHLNWLCSLVKAFSFSGRNFVLYIHWWNLLVSQVCLWTYSLLTSWIYWMLKMYCLIFYYVLVYVQIWTQKGTKNYFQHPEH